MSYLNQLAEECHRISVEHGFWEHQTLMVPIGMDEEMPVGNPSIWAEKIALIHSEASEMLEAHRKRQGEEKLAEECADLLIRLFDFTAARGIDINKAVLDKMQVNRERPRLHNNAY
jgi:phosphoribosyl-ATP pyrophosphohydrolase